MIKKLPHYLALMRFDKPIGSLLLLWPTLWACWLAGEGNPNGVLVWIFAAGVLVMRSAGCVINDYADQDIDPDVERTKLRPLAAGHLSSNEALVLFCVLIGFALALLFLLPVRVWPWSIPAAVLTVAYPFMKRFFQAPQLVLGLAFSFGIPMVYVAFNHPFDGVFWMLILANIMWVVAYDTAYAMSDREDDLKVGIGSTAILFGDYDRSVIALLQLLVLILLYAIGHQLSFSASFNISLAIAAVMFCYQQFLIRERDRARCFQAFLNNGWLGGFILFGIILAA